MKDYYEMLGVSRGAGQEEIKSAYRRLARLHHPDVSESSQSDGGDRFKEVSEAYEVLSDPEKRRRYDLFGEEDPSASPFGSAFDGFGGPLGDIFNIFFGRGQPGASHMPRRGSDLLAVVEVSLAEAYAGTERDIEMPRSEACGECGGSGLAPGFGHDLCPDCGGEGKSAHTRRSSFGTFSSTTTCWRCGGAGEINTHPCAACGGRGASRIIDKVQVNIPAGVDDGDRIRLTGRGEAGYAGGTPGDLYVEVRVNEHDTFTRHGSDLHAVVSVDMSEAALGTEVEIATLNGEEKLQIPAGSQPGDVFRLRGRGMPSVRSGHTGDIFLTLEVRVPRKLNAEQKKLMKELQRIEARKKDSPGIVGRLRKAMRQEY